MDEKDKAKKILKILNKLYPTTPIPLDILVTLLS